MSIHIQVTTDAGTVHHHRHQGFWTTTGLDGWENRTTVESTIHLLNAVAGIGFVDPNQGDLFGGGPDD